MGRLRVLSFAALGGLYLALVGCVTASPRDDRPWTPYLTTVSQAQSDAAGFRVSPISDWRFDATGPVEARRGGEAAFAFSELVGVWFVLEPQPGSQVAAHTLLLFEFSGDRLLGLTVEARRETHERYSALAGLFNAYELSYVWASARDLLTGRAVHLNHQVFVYSVEIDAAQRETLLRNVLARTEALSRRPRFYNTAFSNCTNELAKAAGLDWNHAFILTGLSDEHLFDRGVIPGSSFKATRERADVTAAVQALNTSIPPEAFDAALLAHLRRP